jgi:regulator of sigma E protease
MGQGFITIVAAVFIFGAIIFFHELGHFAAAKLAGVTVGEFAIGMGPAIFKRMRNNTLYSIRVLPIGGYVLLEGEDTDVEGPGSFSRKPVLHRIAILLAGSLSNIAMGYLILVVLTILSGYVGTTVVAGFDEGAISGQALAKGDRILRVNGHRVRTSNDITYEFLRDADGYIDLTVERDGQMLTLPIQFKMEQVAEDMQAISIDFKVAAVPAKPLDYLTYPVNWGLSIVKQVWGAFIDLLTGRYAVNQLSGPVGVVDAIGQASRLGLRSLLLMAAFIAINIGVFNLIPIPILDGGKIVIALIEALMRRRINQKVLDGVMTVSIGLMVLLMVYVTWNDLFRLFR